MVFCVGLSLSRGMQLARNAQGPHLGQYYLWGNPTDISPVLWPDLLCGVIMIARHT